MQTGGRTFRVHYCMRKVRPPICTLVLQGAAKKNPASWADEALDSGSSSRTRTYNNAVNSRGLYH